MTAAPKSRRQLNESLALISGMSQHYTSGREFKSQRTEHRLVISRSASNCA